MKEIRSLNKTKLRTRNISKSFF